jgi:hypothetical protein
MHPYGPGLSRPLAGGHKGLPYVTGTANQPPIALPDQSTTASMSSTQLPSGSSM